MYVMYILFLIHRPIRSALGVVVVVLVALCARNVCQNRGAHEADQLQLPGVCRHPPDAITITR